MASLNRITPAEPSIHSNIKKTRFSFSSSIITVSRSDLNDAVMGALNMQKGFQPCRNKCLGVYNIGNPMSTADQRKQLVKMLVIVLLPLVILASITAVDFADSLSSYIGTEDLISRLNFCVELGDFITALQKERDMSSLYASRIGSDTKVDLLQAYPETDNALEELSSWPVSNSNKRNAFETYQKYVNHINKHRYELDTKNMTSSSEIEFYSEDIEVFIKWMYDTVGESNTGYIWKSLVGYQELIMASEFVGRERGYGIYFYAVGKFRDRSHYLSFIESQDMAMTYFESARQYSILSYNIFQEYLETQNDTLQLILHMRNEVRSNSSSKPDGSVELAKWWFANMSIYRDVMKNVQKKLTSKINRLLEESSQRELTDMIIACAIFVSIVIISPLIGGFVYKLTSNIQKYSISIAKKSNDLRREKKQSETILYQMLPKSVAESLKQNENVDAEHFDACTVFQSDMVGFTRLSASCSPFQVTKMLNALFSCFDSRIELYDVYKVETIGDGYMVVSGVPRRNGTRHAFEIATLALDIMYYMYKLELPHSPGEKFSVRIGCHSGPVLAGVVGTKNPRYCLFGKTVRMAALMESTGKADKIQISEETYNLLQDFDEFTMEERKYEEHEAKAEMKELGLSQRTFWLLKNNQQNWGGSEASVFSGVMSSVYPGEV